MIPHYIVLIINEKDFIGTGFILKNYLLTAAHVVIELPRPSFLYENRQYYLRKSDIRFFTYEKCYEERNDLVKYKVPINSNLRISSNYDKNEPCYYFGFSYSEESKQMIENTYFNIMITHEYAYSATNAYSIRRKYFNCLTCSPSCVEGNSGGPLFQGDSVIGLYIASLSHPPSFIALEDYYIKGEYIRRILDKIVFGNEKE